MKRKILFIILAAILCCFTTAIGQDIMPESPLTFTVNGVSFNMIRVRAGTFTMGAADDDVEAWDDEKPAHQVIISYDYFIAETILTQALWTAVMGTTTQEEEMGTGGVTGLGYGDNYPMYPLSYYDCQEFVDSLNNITGLNFRMPTEAEWEYAARGGHLSKGYKYPGSNNPDEVAWSYANVPDQTVRPVKQLMPNELGLYDMAGNVWEWIYDYNRPYTADSQVNPIGELNSTRSFVRGGSTYKHYTNRHNRVSCRHVEFAKTYKNTRMGFRFVMDDDCKLMGNAQQSAIYDTICSGETYTWHGKQYSKPGTYTDTLANIYGCDSIVTLNLEILPDPPISFDVNGVKFNMVRVRAGTFTMGATPEQGKDAASDEIPAHAVTITRDYFMGETIITQALWTAVMGTTIQEEEDKSIGSKGLGYGDDFPMYTLSYYDCLAFVDSLNKITGLTFRLPTEAEWEYAARGGHLSRGYKYPGSNDCSEVAWNFNTDPKQQLHEVKLLKPNELGIYDMAGNTWEVMYDYKRKYTATPVSDPVGDITGQNTFIRGGSSWYDATYNRVSYRGMSRQKTLKGNRVSCRLVLDANLILAENNQEYVLYDTICLSETYLWNGKRYSKSGSYTDTLTNIYGCDSIVTLHLHFELKEKPEENDKPSTNREPVILSDSLMFIGQNTDSLTEAERYFNPLYLIVAKGKEHLKNQLVRASVCDCDTTIPNRTIGVFSVAKDRQVTFSQGNLQYFPAANLWKFAATQYEQMGNSNKYLSPTYRNWVDLFGWSAENTTAPLGVSISVDNADYSGDFVDWGMAEICGDEPGTWRMLTGEEWNYLFYLRQNAKKLYSKGSINGIRGMILLPDDWQLPKGLYFTAAPNNLNMELDINAYTSEQWQQMERAGAVFLPLMGRRDGTQVRFLEEYGGYWVAVEGNSTKKHFYFNFEDKVFYVPANTTTICYGRAVRLVQDYKP